MSETTRIARWITECQKQRGRVLSGAYSHWCRDGRPVDETTPEFETCTCFPEAAKAAVRRQTHVRC